MQSLSKAHTSSGDHVPLHKALRMSGQGAVLLPGLGSAAQRGLGPSPHVDVQPSVQQENKPGQKGWEGLQWATCNNSPCTSDLSPNPSFLASCQAMWDKGWVASYLEPSFVPPHWWGEGMGLSTPPHIMGLTLGPGRPP